MYKSSAQCFVVTAVLLLTSLAAAYSQATMPGAPMGAYASYFKYYRPDTAGMPAGAAHTSDAVIGMYLSTGRLGALATGFLIYTKRNDHKVCMCTAGHNFEGSFHADVGDAITFDAYMKYLGEPFVYYPQVDNEVSGYKSTLHALVVAKMNLDSATDYADAALLLVNEAELPVESPYMLGYSEEDVYDSSSSFYMIGHPHGMAQRVADSLEFNASSPAGVMPSSQFMFSGTGNNSVANGSSGAPVIFKGPGNFATGIFVRHTYQDFALIPDAERIYPDPRLRYIRKYVGATKIATLMPAIRKHCWQQDSAGIAASHSYKQGITIDNNAQVAEFQTDRSITSQAGIAAAAERGFRVSCPGCILLKANLLTINCSLTPDDSLSRFFGLGKEVRLDAGFSYTASGNYYMDMNTVVPEQAAASTARKARGGGNPGIDGQPDGIETTDFLVYPNPSGSGIFYLRFPKNDDDYSLKVYSSDGRLVHEAATLAGQNPYRFSLAGMAQGVYVLALYQKQTGKKLFSKTIIYQ